MLRPPRLASAQPSAACTLLALLLLGLVSVAGCAVAQTPSREEVRTTLQDALAQSAPRLGAGVVFQEASANRFRYVATLGNQANMESLEILVDVTENDTLTVRAFPKVRGGYVGLGLVTDREAYLHAIARLSGESFFSWALDGDDDLVVVFVITLESGFPREAFDTVLRSLRNIDGQFARLTRFIPNT